MFKRFYVDEFLRRMGEFFECVFFIVSLVKVFGGKGSKELGVGLVVIGVV